MSYILRNVNGLIKIKVPYFKEACELYGIEFIKANYIISPNDAYFAGLVDTDGTVVFNFASNRIECAVELQYNEYTSKLNFDSVIANSKPYTLIRSKTSKKTKKGGAAKQGFAGNYKSIC
jgi:hypothetical protein